MAVHNRFRAKQEQLREEVRLREKKIHDLTDHLENNFGKMAMNSIMPSSRGKSDSKGNFFSTIANMAARFIPFAGAKQGFSPTWKIMAAGIAFRYFRKIMKKRKESKSENQ